MLALEAEIYAPHVPAVGSTTEDISRTSIHMICPSCHAEIETTTITRPGTLTYVYSSCICLFTFGLGCCLIPLLMDDCKEVHHVCPNCEEPLGISR